MGDRCPSNLKVSALNYLLISTLNNFIIIILMMITFKPTNMFSGHLLIFR